MTTLLKVLTSIEKNDTQALLCEIPKELVNDLNVQADGSVDLETLLKICLRVKRADSLKSKKKQHSTLMNLIYNADIAKDFKPKKQ